MPVAMRKADRPVRWTTLFTLSWGPAPGPPNAAAASGRRSHDLPPLAMIACGGGLRRPSALVNILVCQGLAERAARFPHQVRLDEHVDIAVEHAVHIADLLFGAMV